MKKVSDDTHWKTFIVRQDNFENKIDAARETIFSFERSCMMF